MKPKVYLETTVISYLMARPSRDLRTAAHQQATQDWWHDRRVAFDLYASQFVIQEASQGDKAAVEERLKVLEETTLLDVTDEALALAEAIVSRRLVPQKATVDAAHIAVATTNAMDYLLTWNLKHIANAVIRGKVESLCRAEGYEPPIICTPEELMEEVDDG
ncbi:MAG: type II toxin-antitoxin system VapC family toxin [Truepera sp.]|nr:type II toxin-antitoxin system VapC family toxin [Truepera sp.]